MKSLLKIIIIPLIFVCSDSGCQKRHRDANTAMKNRLMSTRIDSVIIESKGIESALLKARIATERQGHAFCPVAIYLPPESFEVDIKVSGTMSLMDILARIADQTQAEVIISDQGIVKFFPKGEIPEDGPGNDIFRIK
jgi:hypothetical protein